MRQIELSEESFNELKDESGELVDAMMDEIARNLMEGVTPFEVVAYLINLESNAFTMQVHESGMDDAYTALMMRIAFILLRMAEYRMVTVARGR